MLRCGISATKSEPSGPGIQFDNLWAQYAIAPDTAPMTATTIKAIFMPPLCSGIKANAKNIALIGNKVPPMNVKSSRKLCSRRGALQGLVGYQYRSDAFRDQWLLLYVMS
jgi:hypothetical protein